MAEWPEIPSGLGYPLVDMDTKRLPEPTMQAIADDITTQIGDPETDLSIALSATFAWQPRTIVGTLPAGKFGWLASDYGITELRVTIGRDGSVRGTVGLTPEGLFNKFSTALTAPGATFYVNVGGARTVDGVEWAAGSNSNNGLSPAAPFKSLNVAITAVNTAAPAAGASIFALAGMYLDGDCMFALTSDPLPATTVDLALISVGGRVLDGRTPATIGTPSLHGTYTNTYSVTLAARTRAVLDKTHIDEFGNYRRYLAVGSAAICNATPGTFYRGASDSATPIVNPFPGVGPIRDHNTAFLLSSLRSPGDINFYMGGQTPADSWELHGGSNNVRWGTSSPMASRKVSVLSGVVGRYASSGTYDADAFGVLANWRGLVAMFDVEAYAPDKDCFNVHSGSVGSPAANPSRLLTVNCAGILAGQQVNVSCNGGTVHENVQWVDVAGTYRLSRGGTVHDIDTSEAYLLGSLIADDEGDVMHGGSYTPRLVRAAGSAGIWLERCTVSGEPTTIAYDAPADGAIHLKDPYPTPLASTGTVTTY